MRIKYSLLSLLIMAVYLTRAVDAKQKLTFDIIPASQEEADFIDNKIADFCNSKVPFAQNPNLILKNYIIKDNGAIIAGIKADIYYWNILYIEVLFIDEQYRGQGLGSALLNKIESEARAAGVTLIHLDTFDFQAKDFYLKHGYELFGVLDDCPKGNKRYYMKKDLLSMAPDKHFEFKKITEHDISLLLGWFKEPHVVQWWPTPDEGQTIAKFLEQIRSKDTFGYIVLLNEKPLGYIQYYRYDPSSIRTGQLVPNLPKTTLGTDQFIGDPQSIGKGYGTQLLKEFIAYLRTIEPAMTTIIVDPNPENIAAIRCYEKVGFKRMETYETQWGPTLLMRYDVE